MSGLLMEVSPLYEPVSFKISQVLCEDFLRDAGHFPQELGTAHRWAGKQAKKDRQLPPSGQHS
jgi:hypothetical protein